MDDKNTSTQTSSTPVITPQNDGTVQYAAASPVVSSQPVAPLAAEQGVQSPINLAYESLDGPDENSTQASTSIVASSTATQNVAAQPTQTPAPKKQTLGFRDKDTSKLLTRVIAGALVVILLLFSGTMISSRISNNRAVEPVSQLDEQEVVSLQGSGTPLDVKTNGSTLLVNGSVLATQSLQVTNGSANATIVFAGVNEDRTYTLPNAAGVFCLDTNNCGYLQAEDITTTSVAGVDGALTLGSGLAINGSEISNTITQTSVNNSTGSIIIQGTTNQVGLSKNGNTITLTSPQDIGQTSSPTFNSITLSGVGTQNGNVLCDISNNCGYAGGTGAYIQDGNSFGETAVLGTNDAFDLAFETNGVTRIVVDTSGNTTVSGQILSANAGTTANPAFSFLFDEDTGLYRAADNTVGISTGGANNTTFSTSGVDIQGRVTIGDAAGAPGAAAGLLVQETFTAADSFCTFGCYGAQIIAIADNPLANNGIAALAVQAQTAATAFVQTNATGLFVGNTAAGAGSTINNGYGIRVNDQTGATNNYGIAIGTANTQALWIGNTADSTTASNGIGFGISRDTNLYRSAADTLRTDDTFISGTRIGINTSTFGTNNRLTVNANTTTDNLAALQINTGATTNKGLVIQRSAGQTANLQEWQSSTGSVLTYIDASGFLNSPRFKENTNGVVIGGAASPEAGTNVLVESTGASNKALVVKGFTGQTANLQEWQSSTGTALTTVTSSGEMRFYSDATNYAAIAAQTGGSLLINTVTGGSITIVPDSNLNLGTVNTGQILMGRTGTDIPIALRGTTTLSVVSASSRPLTIRGAAGQTANLTEWQNSSSTVLGSIGATGAVLFQNSTNSTNALRVLNAAGTTTVLNVDTTNGRVGIGNAAPTAELDVTGDTVVSNRLQVGPTGNTIGQCATIFGPISCDVALDIANASTETAIGTHGIYNNVSINPGSANSASNYASYNTITTQGANSFSGTATTGVYGATIIGNTAGTIARAVGVEGNAGIFTTTSTTVVSEAIGVLAGTGVISTVSGGTVTNNYGMYVSAANITGAGASITNNYGLYVNPQTAGGSDYGIAVGAADTQTLWLSSNADNTTAAAGIAFGLSRDTNLYRSAANTLRTDDALSVGDDITVTGDILPSADDTYDLGSNSNRWRDLYLGPATLSIGTSSADYKISYDTGGNSLLLNNDQADRDFRIAGDTQANLLYVDAGNNRVGIGTNTPGYELDVVGTLNASTGINVNGTQVCTSGGCTAAAGSGNYIQNGTSIQTNSNLAIQSAAAGSIGAVIRGAASQTASLQEWQNSSGTVLANVLSNGTFALGTTNVGALLNLRSATTPTGTPTEAAATIRLNTVFNDLGSGNNSTGAIEFGNSTVRTWRSDNTLRVSAYDGVTIDTNTANTAAVSLKVKAVASQSGDLQQWQNSSGTRLTSVESTGSLYSPTAPIKLGWNVALQAEYSSGGGFVDLIKRGSGNGVIVGNSTADTSVNANTYLDLTVSGGNGIRMSSYNVNKYGSIGYLGSAGA
nr:hypothetical protein [Candidatus Saccharibacteria bacterium]